MNTHSKPYLPVFDHRTSPADADTPTIIVGSVGNDHRGVLIRVPGHLADALKHFAPLARSTAILALADYALAELTRKHRRLVSMPLPRIDDHERLPLHGRKGRPSPAKKSFIQRKPARLPVKPR